MNAINPATGKRDRATELIVHVNYAGKTVDVPMRDLYPGIYQGPPTEPQQLYRLPQLTYADDHPGNKIPAIRVLFDITPAPTRRAATSARD